MMMMGYIRGVDRDRLLVGLPFGLVGYVLFSLLSL